MEDPMADAPTPHPEIVALQYPLSRLTEALKRQRKIKIVAIGSSSTAGEGDVIPFPHRLELLLRAQYPGRMIDVVNRGIGGQEAPEEFARFEGDVGAEGPVLVIWQMGTNAIYHRSDYNLQVVAANIEAGVAWLKALSVDVILMDTQYAPALFWNNDQDRKPDPAKTKDTYNLVAAISAIATAAEVNLFKRFALMDRWVNVDHFKQDALICPDGLHQTEVATDAVTKALNVAMVSKIGPVPGSPLPEV
jgi:GDSL-like lipase/acylhydrolase family protein